MLRFVVAAIVAWAAALGSALGQSALEACAGQFIGGDVGNVPTIGRSPPAEPFSTNRHLCYRVDETSFFALEYWPERFAPRWAAYRLDPENYGSDGCRTYTRGKGNCYVRAETWEAFEACTSAGDPFHADTLLEEPKLAPNDFGLTGHDQGHIAPRQSFSWHVCGAYQTFTMANMSPQRAFLNQDIWAALERQVLTWGVDEGPLYVVTGTIFRRFPHERFAVYADGTFDAAQIYPPGAIMVDVVTQHRINFMSHPSGHILCPKRNADPERVAERVRQLPMPTGYYKVVYRPADDDAPARAIGFLIPHSFENLNVIPGFKRAEAFWAFTARIDLIEEVSGTRFPGIAEEMKRVWGDRFFLSKRTAREIRSRDCGLGTPTGVIENTTRDERIAMCAARPN